MLNLRSKHGKNLRGLVFHLYFFFLRFGEKAFFLLLRHVSTLAFFIGLASDSMGFVFGLYFNCLGRHFFFFSLLLS